MMFKADDVTQQLPSITSFAPSFGQRESMADQCPTIQNLLRHSSAQAQGNKLPGIQHFKQQHSKPPPPYPNQSYTSSYASSVSTSPRNIAHSDVHRHLNESPSLNMINAECIASPTLAKDPFLRPNSRKGSEIASPCSELAQMMNMSRSPRSSSAVSPAPSTCSEVSFGHLLWEDDVDRKPVLTQWQNTDSDTLFMELSSSVLSQI